MRTASVRVGGGVTSAVRPTVVRKARRLWRRRGMNLNPRLAVNLNF